MPFSGKIDLHTHTTFSDGSSTPAQLIFKVHRAGINVLSITDHDTIAALPHAAALCQFYNITLVTGVEFSTYLFDREVHILGYFFDPENNDVVSVLQQCLESRIGRAERIVAGLQKLQLAITLEEVLAEAGNAAVTRPHIASVLVKKKQVGSFYEAFNKYRSNDGPCYEKKFGLEPRTVIELMRQSGGISVLAHPSDLGIEIISKVIADGIDGLEVFHPSHSNPQTKQFAEIARKKNLFITGGSDFHGGKRNDDTNVGKYLTPSDTYRAMLQMRHRAKAV